MTLGFLRSEVGKSEFGASDAFHIYDIRLGISGLMQRFKVI